MPKCERFGESALVLSCDEDRLVVQRRLWPLARVASTWDGVIESVAGAGNLTLAFDRRIVGFESLAQRLLQAWEACKPDESATRTIEIPVCYDGPDLESVAQSCGLDVRTVAEMHAAGRYVVSFMGFQPGFAYLDGLDERLRVARRAQPRKRVPAGSVAIADGLSGVYPFDSPGGWQLIGRTTVRLFDPLREPAALLVPGDAVRFVAL